MKNLIVLLLTIATMISISSCSNDEKEDDTMIDSDAYSIILNIKVVNPAGQNLLDKDVTGNILDEKMTLTFDRQTSDVALSKPNIRMNMSRYYLPTWYGAYITKTTFANPQYYCIEIGEFDGAEDGRQSMELNLCGHKYELSFTNTGSFNRKNELPDYDRCFYLDGKLIQSGGSPIGTYIITLNR